MPKRPRITKEKKIIQDKILCFLHYRFANSDDIVFTGTELLESLPGISRRIFEYALEDLQETDLVDIEKIEEEGESFSGYMISNEGVNFVDSWKDDYYDGIAEGIDFLDALDSRDSTDETLQDTWAPLPLERSSQAFESALAASEAAYQGIAGNNGYAESDPEERDRIVWSLDEGLRQMKEGFPSRDQVVAMLVKPLKFVAEKFAAASMGEIAKSAVRALIAWLG